MKATDEKQISWVGRLAALAALLIVLVLAAFVFLASDPKYTVRAQFKSASQLVKGNTVQVSGRNVGLVKEIELAPNGVAEVELEIDDEVAPLRVGTQATIRQVSESSIAGRYIDLHMPSGESQETIPRNGLIPQTDTQSQVDLDQFFALFDKRTREGLRNFIRGNGRIYQDRSREANESFEYLNPSLVATRRLFEELTYDQESLESFLVSNARLLTDIAEKSEDVEMLVDRLATAFGAIAAERESLSTAIAELPPFMRRANTTFVNLRATLDDLDPLVEESKPITPKLRRMLAALRPFARDARPAVRDLAALVRAPGEHNDLIDLGRSVPPFRNQTVRPVRRNGKVREGSFPTAVRSLRQQTPHFAFQRPYVVDLTGWFDDFSHSGIYDANGSASRVSTNVSAFAFLNGNLTFVPEELRDEAVDQVASLGQRNRCPGATERRAPDNSNAYRPDPGDCDPSQVPPG